jgi:magnesium transporter
VLTAYLFDRKSGAEVEGWKDSFRALSKDEVFWVDLAATSEGEIREASDVFGFRAGSKLAVSQRKASLTQEDGYLVVTVVAVSDEEPDIENEHVVLDCFVGPNWLLTAHQADIAVINEFREAASGDGELGTLDAPSFLANLLEWVVGSYLRAFDEIEAELEQFDIEALSSPSRDPETQIRLLTEARQRVGSLRRSLAPHREVFAALSHSEFDLLSSETSSQRFAELNIRLDSALASARDVKDAIASSFDVLIVRTEHRTNEIVKILTIVSILLLPGALLAGVAGMNVNLNADAFFDSGLFWLVVVAIVLIAFSTLGLARQRRWL